MIYTELLGFIAAFLTTISFLPQAVKVYRTNSSKDLSLPMFLIFTTGIICWLLYGIAIVNWPMICANTVTFILSAYILYHKLKYRRR